jgi:hypothetical protein
MSAIPTKTVIIIKNVSIISQILKIETFVKGLLDKISRLDSKSKKDSNNFQKKEGA